MIRIEGPEGRQAYFAATHQEALGVLRALESTTEGLGFKAIAALVASDGLRLPALRIRNTLVRLERVGIVRRKKRGLYSRVAGYTVTALEGPYAPEPRRWSPQRAQTEAELRKRPKIRIVGRGGRAAQFGVAQDLALSVLCILAPAGLRMSTKAIAARLAECRAYDNAGRIHEVLQQLRRIGVVRLQGARLWELGSRYVITVVESTLRSGIDWMQNDRELACRLGLSRERIRQIRRENGATPSPFKRLHQSTIAFRLWLRQNLERAGALKAEQIAAETGFRLSRQVILAGMQAAGVDWVGRLQLIGPLHPLKEARRFNPALPSRDLVEIWGLTAGRFSALRSRPDFGPPRWNPRTIRKRQGTPEYEEYCRALEDERRKAAAYRTAPVQQPLR